MRKWCVEDWEFELTVTEGKAAHCGLPFCGQIQYLVDKREKIGNTKKGLAT